MTENKPSVVACEDSEGNRYEVLISADLVAGSHPPDIPKNPIYYLSLEGEVERLVADRDPKTGEEFFICPGLDNLKLFPLY